MNAMASDFQSEWCRWRQLDDKGLSDLSVGDASSDAWRPGRRCEKVALTAFSLSMTSHEFCPASQQANLAAKIQTSNPTRACARFAAHPSRSGFFLHRPVVAHAHDTGEAVPDPQLPTPTLR